MTNKKEILNEELLIKNYYKLSEITNRYITILVSLILSVLIFSTSMNSSKNLHNTEIIASSNILKTVKNVNVWLNKTNFNNKSKSIKANLIVTKSYVQKNKSYLWIWIFTNKKETLYMPMNTILLNKYDINYNNFVLILKNWIYKTTDNNIKPLKTTIQLTIWDLIKKYSLSCINTTFNNSLFCNLNKKIVINKLIKQKSFELTRNTYNFLFKNIFYTKKEKCNIIKKIFNLKYNWNNIKDISKNNCENTDNIWYNNMKKIMDIYNTILWKNLFTDKISKYQDVALTKLSQQQFYLISNWISYSRILINLKTIRKLINNWYITENIAIVTKKILKIILNKSIYSENYENIKKNILSIENWNNSIWENWLNNLIHTKNNQKNNQNNNNKYILIKNNLHSQKELINNILNNSYKNIFTATSIVYNKDTKISNIEWYLNLSFDNKQNWNKVNKKIKISFILTNLLWKNFNINNVNINNQKINKYINYIWYNINKENTLLWLKKYLEKILYNPLILNDYWKQIKLSICEKVKKYIDWSESSCSDWIITTSIQNKKIEWWLKIMIKLNNSLLIESIEISKVNIKYKTKWTLIKETLELDLSAINQSLKTAIGDKLNGNTLSIIKGFVKKSIDKIKDKKIKEMVGMSDTNIITLNHRFGDKLWAKIQLIRHIKWDFYKVYFNILDNTFVWIYEYNKNKIIHIWLLVKSQSDNYKLFLFKNINLSLSNNNIEKLNQFKLEPLNTLKTINLEKYTEYLNYIKKIEK